MSITVKELIVKLQALENQDMFVGTEGCDCYGWSERKTWTCW